MSYTRESFDNARIYGEQAEAWVFDLIEHLRHGSPFVEVKRKSRRDLQFYVEMEKFSYGRWVPSGLQATKAAVWFFVIDDMAISLAITTDQLWSAVRKASSTPGRSMYTTPSATQPTRGWLLHLNHILDATREKAA